jgi:hypothetical protein
MKALRKWCSTQRKELTTKLVLIQIMPTAAKKLNNHQKLEQAKTAHEMTR